MKPDYQPARRSMASFGTLKKQKCFSLVKIPALVYGNGNREQTLCIGTLVHVVKRKDEKFVYVKIVNVRQKYNISEEDIWICRADCLIAVDQVCWPFLEAVPCEVGRVALLSQEGLVQQLASLSVGKYVYVVDDIQSNYYKAVVRYIGKIPSRGPGHYFGVELLGGHDLGDTDGTIGNTSYFKCEKNSGLFCSISQIKPFHPSKSYEESKKGKSTVQQLTALFDKKRMNKSSSAEHVLPNRTSSKWYCDLEAKPKADASSDCPLAVGDKVVWVTDDVIECVVQSIDSAKKKVNVTLECAPELTRPSLCVDIAELVKAGDFYGHNDSCPKENGDLITWDTVDEKTSPVAQDLIAFNSPPKSITDGKEYDFITSSSEGSGYYDLPDPDDSLVVGSMVEITHRGLPHYGVIRWIGVMQNAERGRKMAGIEMEDDKPEFCDGSLGGRKYFVCNPHKGYFVPFSHCRQDSRFMESIPHASIKTSDGYNSSDFGGVDSPIVPGCVSPISGEEDISPICGKYKGIQGHHNSCYLDATLFSMFTFTSVFDSLLYRPPGPSDIPHYKEVQRVLREEIVNPLRKYYYVRADRVMKLRRLMERLSNVSGLTTEEKDPEEFLTSLVAQILKADPYLKLGSGQEAYHYQLFVEKNEKLVLPTVQQLFEQSFFTSDIKLKEVPACLIIQMPRFGKSFKMYPRILPSQLLDVTDVIEDSPRQCNVCGNLAFFECRECFDQGSPSEIGLQNIAFCKRCVYTVHSHEDRRAHKWRELKVPSEFVALQQHCAVRRLYMQLFAVVCIETSHYVTFVKCGFGSDAPWCFFDSMADRKGEQNGYNIPEVVPCPDLPHWLSDQGAVNLQQIKDDRQLPEHAKRLLCDPYMCMYQSLEVMMYR